MQGNGKSNDKLFKETEGKVKQWLTDEGFNYGRNANQPGYVWAWDATGPGNWGGSFSQVAGHPECFWLSVSIQLDAYQQDIKKLSPAESKDLLFTLRQRLTVIGIKFDLGNGLGSITFREQIFTETLTREKFWESVNRVRRAMDCTVWTLDEKLPDPSGNPINPFS